MTLRSIKGAAMAAVGLLSLGLLAGCNTSQDTGTVVNETPEQAAQQKQRIKERIQEVQNDQRIPPDQKRAILARLSQQAGGGPTEAEVRNKEAEKSEGSK